MGRQTSNTGYSVQMEGLPEKTRLLFFGHLANDSLYTSLPPLLPILALHHNLSTASLGLIPAAYLMTASFMQVGVGYLHDRKNLNILMPVGLLLGGFTIASIGFTDSYFLILFLAFLGGIGSALFHPIATSLSSISARRSTSVSFFMTGGDLGLAAGSFICSAAVAVMGLKGTAFLAVLPLAAATLLLLSLRQTPSPVKTADNKYARSDVKKLLTALTASFLRATTNVALITYLPLYLSSKGFGIPFAGGILTVMILAGAVGMISAGFLGDKIGKKQTAQAYLLFSAALIPVAVSTSAEYALLTFPLIGVGLFGAHPILVALSHDIMPKNLGMASALMYGFTFGVANLAVPFVGAAADSFGYDPVFIMLALFPLAGALVVSKISPPVQKSTIN